MAYIIFDYDGTLHKSDHIYAPAFRKAVSYLYDKKLVDMYEYTDEEIVKWIGVTPKDMWESFASHISKEEQEVCSNIISDEMLRLIENKVAQLYPRALEVLETLKSSGHHLIFLSNCKIKYMLAHRACFSLDNYFDEFYCSEQFGFIPKYKIYESIQNNFSGEVIVIGDRIQDIEIAIKYDLISIGCSYGYGKEEELINSNFCVSNISDILLVLQELIN